MHKSSALCGHGALAIGRLAIGHWDAWRHANYVLVSKLPPSAANPSSFFARRTTRIVSFALPGVAHGQAGQGVSIPYIDMLTRSRQRRDVWNRVPTPAMEKESI